MNKDTTLICTIGNAIKIFHSTEKAKDMYENKRPGHEVVALELTDEDFERLTKRLSLI